MIGLVLLLLFKVYYAESGLVSSELGCNITLRCSNNRRLNSYSYEWNRISPRHYKINDGDKYSGTNTETLTILHIDNSDTGGYNCLYKYWSTSQAQWGTRYDLTVHINEMWSDWTYWGLCPVSCGGGTQSRTRLCNNPSRSGNGKDFNGMWSGWSLSVGCSVTCGGGFQFMDRRCDKPSPSFGGEHFDGKWSGWSQLNTCSATCGGGTQYRTRQCNNPPQSAGGKNCVGSNRDDSQCGTNRCPDWTGWIAWGSCETTCGDGYRRRKRNCKYVGKEVNANKCPGTSEEVLLCHFTPCKEPESTFNAGPVAGGIGAVLVVLFVVFGVIFIVRRRRRFQKGSNQRYSQGVSRAEPNVNYRPGDGQTSGQYINVNAGALNTSAVSNENHSSGSIMLQNENIPSGSSMVQNNTDDSQTYNNLSDINTKIKVDDLKNYIAMKQSKDALKEEYKKVPYGPQYPTAQSQLKENMPKNRFKTTVPYDHSRVILEEIHGKANSDYINADYMDGFKKASCYVACQGPVKHTIEDHWRMIWQTNISKIVMLTNLIEGGKVKCERYWPTGGKPMDVGNFNLTLTAEKERAAYITREISVVEKKTGQKKYIIQYHFTAWPDHGTPDPLYLVLFHKHVANDCKTEETGPLLVHCSAGIGRTGTYIALDALLEEGLATGCVDIAEVIAKMRYCRMSMIQTAEQYICLHYALLEAFTMKDTCIRKENFDNFWREMLSDKRPVNQNKLHEEFKMLKAQKSEHGKSDYTTALSTGNISKNRSRNVLPMDTTRLFLVSFGRGRSDYINAVPVPSFTKFVGYITTQLPLPDTKVDFWTMIKDHDSSTIVLLLEDMKEIECVYSALESVTCGPFTIKVKRQIIGDQGITEASLMMSNKNDRPREVALYQAVCKSTPEPAVLCRLVNLISSRVSLSNDPVTVVCSDGAKNCGLFCALSNAISSMQIDDSVDIFQIVRLLQLQRPEFFTDFNEYRMCYEALDFHIDTSNVYANF